MPTLARWRKERGLPIWERPHPKSKVLAWWIDDHMLLAWKLKMAQLSRAKRYKAKAGRGAGKVSP